jgi:hypothetical protein
LKGLPGKILRHVFERIVAACMAAGLVKGEGFAADTSVMEANASRYHGKAPDDLDWADGCTARMWVRQGSISAVIAGDDERSAAALPLRSQHGFGDRVRSSQSYGTGA